MLNKISFKTVLRVFMEEKNIFGYVWVMYMVKID